MEETKSPAQRWWEELGVRLTTPSSGKLYYNGVEISLSEMRFRILKFFLENLDRVITRQQVLEEVYSRANPKNNSVDVHVNYLRKNVINSYNLPFHIETIVNEGYRLVQRKSAYPVSS